MIAVLVLFHRAAHTLHAQYFLTCGSRPFYTAYPVSCETDCVSLKKNCVSVSRIMSHSHSSLLDLPPFSHPQLLTSLLPPSRGDQQPPDPRTAVLSGRLENKNQDYITDMQWSCKTWRRSGFKVVLAKPNQLRRQIEKPSNILTHRGKSGVRLNEHFSGIY